MTEQEFLSLAKSKYREIESLNEKPNLLEYEQGLVEIMQELGRQIAEKNIGSPSEDRRKKRNINPLLDVSK